MSLREFDVRITQSPSAGEATERTVGIAVDIPLDVEITELDDEPLSVTVGYDGQPDDGIKTYTDLETRTFDIYSVGEKTYELAVLIPTNETYELRVDAVLTEDNRRLTAYDLALVDGFEPSPTPDGQDDVPRDETELVTIDGERRADVTPQIAGIEPITMRTDYQLPFESDSNQSACGQTQYVQNGDKNWRVVIEGVLSLTQFRQLQQLRRSGQTTNVDVTTAEFGTIEVSFDQINVTRPDQEHVGEVDDEVGPLIKFQVQTKENSQDGLFGG